MTALEAWPLCMAAICSTRFCNSVTFSGLVVMDTAMPAAVSATATDVPWRLIGQFIIGIPGFCSDGPPCMPPAASAAGTNINITRTFFICLLPGKHLLVRVRHATLHNQSPQGGRLPDG